MVARVTPILRADEALRSAEWYSRLGFEVAFVHQFKPGSPRFVTIRAGDEWIFLSEHEGDARPDTLVYLHVDDVDAVAGALGVTARRSRGGCARPGSPTPPATGSGSATAAAPRASRAPARASARA